jgi:transposase
VKINEKAKEPRMSQALVLGVDMAKGTFVAASRVENQEVQFGAYANDVTGFDGVQKQVQQQCAEQGVSQVHMIIEATGGYEAALVAYAYAQGWLVSMPNPKQVRDWAKGMGYRVKTDRIDARILAHYGVVVDPPARPQLAQEVTELDSLLKRRLDLEQALHKEKTRLSELNGRPGIAPKVRESLQRVIDALQEALGEIQTAIDALCKSYAPFAQQCQRLLALPGIGLKNVLPLLVKLFQWHTLTHGQGDSEGLTALVGLDPQPYESGRSVHKHPGISKMGDAELRRLLYMGALGSLRGNNPLKAFYQRLVGRGKAKKLALTAAARKLLVWAWTIFSRQIEWNPDFHHI